MSLNQYLCPLCVFYATFLTVKCIKRLSTVTKQSQVSFHAVEQRWNQRHCFFESVPLQCSDHIITSCCLSVDQRHLDTYLKVRSFFIMWLHDVHIPDSPSLSLSHLPFPSPCRVQSTNATCCWIAGVVVCFPFIEPGLCTKNRLFFLHGTHVTDSDQTSTR